MVSKRSKNNSENDEILRLEDIVPPFKKVSVPLGKKGQVGKASDALRSGVDVPRFNLAEQIMSRQRRETATRRNGPGIKKPPTLGSNSSGSAIPSEIPLLTEQRQILEEIVARDIERLTRGMPGV